MEVKKDMTYSKIKIKIPQVTGSISIEPTEIATNFNTNLADTSSADWIDGQEFNTSGLLVTSTSTPTTSTIITNYIECKKGDTIQIYGLDRIGQKRSMLCLSDKTKLLCNYLSDMPIQYIKYHYDEINRIVTIKISHNNVKYIRFGGIFTSSKNDIKIINKGIT